MNYITTIAIVTSGVALLSTGLLGWVAWGIWKQTKKLFGSKPLPENIYGELLRRLTRAETKLAYLEPRTDHLEEISKISVQKVGFLRFNPFQDTGGDNSFIAAFLDGKNNGVLISSLYTREGVRLYAKQILAGSSRNHLSEEEQKILQETLSK
jgi:hypothetical protein